MSSTGILFSPQNLVREPTFGSFRVLRKLGNGRFATVFLGQRVDAGALFQPAAIKVIHPHLTADRAVADMVLAEARLLAAVSHPNVCGVLEFGEARGACFLALEFLLAETWLDLLRKLQFQEKSVRIAPELIARVFADAAQGMHAIQLRLEQTTSGQGMHRYLTPRNIHVGYDGSVRVRPSCIASSVARANGPESPLLQRPFGYMAPEQLRGERTGRAADIWSLGVMLRESLMGRRLFRGSTDEEVAHAVMHAPLPAWPPHVPVQLRAIVDRALHRNPEQRYATAEGLATALEGFLHQLDDARIVAELSAFTRGLFPQRHEDKQRLLFEAAKEGRLLTVGRVQKSDDDEEEKTRVASELSVEDGAGSREPGQKDRAALSRVRARKTPPEEKLPPPDPENGALFEGKQANALGLRRKRKRAQHDRVEARALARIQAVWELPWQTVLSLALAASGLAWLVTRALVYLSLFSAAP